MVTLTSQSSFISLLFPSLGCIALSSNSASCARPLRSFCPIIGDKSRACFANFLGGGRGGEASSGWLSIYIIYLSTLTEANGTNCWKSGSLDVVLELMSLFRLVKVSQSVA